MRAPPDEPNVHLRKTDEAAREVVLAFPYDGNLVAAVRTLPGRRFDWDRREWSAPADDWVAVRLGEILRLYPDLSTTTEVADWGIPLGNNPGPAVQTRPYTEDLLPPPVE